MSKKSFLASDGITVVGFEDELSPGIFQREYPGGRFAFLRCQIGQYVNVPQYAPAGYEKVVISSGEFRFIPRGARLLPDKKRVFQLIGFGDTPEKAVARAFQIIGQKSKQP